VKVIGFAVDVCASHNASSVRARCADGLIVSGMALFSGTEFPRAVLPSWLRPLGDIPPLSYSLDALRGSALQHRTVGQLSHDILLLSCFCVVLVPLALYALRTGFRIARTRATFARC
jgi:ABC-type multidrug transport system permease subunit